jgi:trans-4-hydroxy-L-proline dehydratase
MTLSPRVQSLRQHSLDARETLSAERAELLTRFYAHELNPADSIPMQRARSFAYLLEHKTVSIGAGELIAGEKGPAAKHAPTYPELCCHSLQDLDILNSRPKTSFRVAPETRRTYAETVIPFWQGKSLRERIFARMTPEWHAAYAAGGTLPEPTSGLEIIFGARIPFGGRLALRSASMRWLGCNTFAF